MADLFMERDAVISDCGEYRHLLRRVWDHAGPRVLFWMLNPSTADAELDDPTIRSCIRLAKSWGYGSLEVVNLFGYRATDPDELMKADDPYGWQNDGVIEGAVDRCDIVILAWGAHKMARNQGQRAVDIVLRSKPTAYCLGKTKSGAPKHPLYIKSGTQLESWSPNP